jgi:hypothetical protein
MVFVALAFGAEASAFTLLSNKGKPAYWPNNTAHYRFNTSTSGYFNGGVDASGTSASDFSAIRKSFQTWMNLPGINLTIIEDPSTSTSASSSDGSNTVQWVKTGWRNLSFRPPSNALAVTLLSFDSGSGALTDADIYFNSDTFPWAVVDSNSENGYVDVQNIATHEIGHFLGLDHSSEDFLESDSSLADATMYYASMPGETSRRDLHADDMHAILSLYGSADRGTVTLSTVELVSSQSGRLQYRIRGSGFSEYTSFVLTKNSSAELDVVARYRSILSTTEALAEFDVLGMSGGDAAIVGFNDPRHLSSISVSLTSATLGATQSGGGGGGCSLTTSNQVPPLSGILSLLFSLFAWGFRRRTLASVRSRRLE